MNIRFARTGLLGIAWTLTASLALPAQNTAPVSPDPDVIERLRRDQDEILRKAERLQSMMQRLLQRYQREGKKEQVQLIEQGLAHLERSGILRDVASIREDLAATALTEAVRKQREVVDDLERLLNILLERKSVESLDQQLQQLSEQTRSARELERRQQELIDATKQALQNEATPAEKELLANLSTLQKNEQREAERNARQAGARQPFLESALDHVRELLRQQAVLEKGLEAEASGRQPEARAREFDLRGLTQRTQDLQQDLADQKQQKDLETAAGDLQKAAEGTDQQAIQQARDALQSQLQSPPKRGAGPDGKGRDPDWAKLKEQLEATPAGTSDQQRQQLQDLAKQAAALAAARQQEAQTNTAAQAAQRTKEAAELAKQMQAASDATKAGEQKPEDQPGSEVEKARDNLEAAQKAAAAGDAKTANENVDKALADLDKALAKHRQQNPDTARQAAKMAADSAAAAQELQNAPGAGAEEQQTNDALRKAMEAQREVESKVGEARDAGQKPDAAKPAAESRQQLEKAQQTLENAINAAAKDTQQERADAADRQQQLQQAAQQAEQQVAKAAQQGQLNDKQQSAAQKKLQQAQQHMQSASQKLQQGQQSSAAKEQQSAAEAVQQAMDELQQNKPVTDEQKKAMEQQAKAQEQLADDILKLAEELKKRENKGAERAANQAADAAKKAQRAMETGDDQEAQQQQEEARQKLDEAAKQLDEEKDRYQDLRQEELLFRMKDELTTFLDKQRPITAETLEAQKAGAQLSRPARHKLNQLGEEEQSLATKIDFLVKALAEEGNLVYLAVLRANLDDLGEVARRLAGRAPDAGAFTTLMQQDVERRTEELLAALERERQRREQERKDKEKDKQEGQPKGKNRFNPQREQLVSLIAELEMLKTLGADTRRATDDLHKLVELSTDEAVSDAELALIERLANRHSEITRLFQQIKHGVEETLQQMQGNDQGDGTGH